MLAKETKIDSTCVYKGKIITVTSDNVMIDDNSQMLAKREIVHHHGGVVGICKASDNKIFFVKQYRYAVGDYLLELPAGKIEKNENPDTTILREMEEEVGIIPTEITSMGKILVSPGISDEVLYLYYINKYEIAKQHFDVDERIDLFTYSYDEALQMIENGQITDAKTICLIYKTKKYFMR